MKLLLDTVALYRFAVMPESLSPGARSLIADDGNQLFVSAVSAWELAIKASLGKLALPCKIDEFFSQTTRDLLAETVNFDLRFVAKMEVLPHLHGDPFDRMIIAQALVDGYTVLTSDSHFASYGVNVLW